MSANIKTANGISIIKMWIGDTIFIIMGIALFAKSIAQMISGVGRLNVVEVTAVGGTLADAVQKRSKPNGTTKFKLAINVRVGDLLV